MKQSYGTDYQSLAHAWVYNKDEDFNGYCYGHRMYANNKTIYSYGSHFPIAHKYKDVVFVNSDSASVTTSKQQYIVERAIYQLLYKVSGDFISVIGKSSAINEIKRQDFQAVQLAKKLHKARAPHVISKYVHEIEEIVNTINFLIKEFRVKSKLPTRLKNLTLQFYTGEEWKILEEKRVKKEVLRNKRQIKKWRKGSTNFVRINSSYDLLRVLENTVETSQGVAISIDEFTRLYKLLHRKSLIGQVIANTSYTVLSVTEQKVVIGCHNIEREEVEMIAKQLNIKL